MISIPWSREKVTRLTKIINKGKNLRSFIKFSKQILKGNAWKSVWRICMWILGLKGIRISLQISLSENPGSLKDLH